MKLISLLLFAVVHLAHGYVQFQHTLVPITDEAKERISATERATIGYSTTQGFNKVARTKELHNCVLPGCTLMGEVLNIEAQNVTAYDPKTLKMRVRTVKEKKGKKVTQRSVQFSHSPSAGVLLHEEITDRWYMIYQFETPNPGTMYRVWLRLVNDTQISTKLNLPINMGAFGGLWKPRVALQTPTNSMLGAEGSVPDAMVLESVKCLSDSKETTCLSDLDPDLFYDVMDFMRYFDRQVEDLKDEGKLKLDLTNAIPGFKPYRYGFPYELQLRVNDDDRVLDDMKKLYAMGRTGASGISVMQNGFTVYMAGGNGGLFRFIDEVGGFKSGVLSAAVLTVKDADSPVTQIGPGVKFDIEWVEVGLGDTDGLAEFVSIDSELRFSDLMEYAEYKGGCKSGFKPAKVGDRIECLSLNNRELAGIMEPERVAALYGATVDIFRFSQIATRLDSAEFYIGSIDVSPGEIGVSKSKKTTFLEGNRCGCVFKVITDDSYNAVSMETISCGDEMTSDSGDPVCSTEAIANPRALAYANQFEQILVGEDSPYHDNNFVWAIDSETLRQVRIFHAPRKGRVTSLSWYQDVLGGNNYIGITIAEPYDELGWMSYFGSFELEYKKSLAFSDVSVPYDVGPANLPIGFARVTSGDSSTFDGFTSIVYTGMKIKGKNGQIVIGEILDHKGKPVNRYAPAPVEPKQTDENEIAHSLAFSSMIDSCGSIYAVTSTNSLPGMNYVISLDQKKNVLTASSASIVDWKDWGGLWRSGGGTISPWTTHISGEIHEPDALDFLGYQCITGFSSCFKSQAERSFDDSIHFLRYHDIYVQDLENKFAPIGDNFNPYQFGYVYEVKVIEGGCVQPTKYMNLGRFSHGGISIMPDGKTVYMTDFTNGRSVGGGFFRFVADKENDLSSGTLYAAKFKSEKGSAENFDINWIKLGKADNDELVKAAASIRFTDMFEYIPSTKNCRLTQINVKSEVMCLRVKPGMENYAAFFETRRYAALQGATIELGNTKGITFDSFSAKLYISISAITGLDKIMLQDDVEGSSNDLKFPTLNCGCIYAMSLTTKYEIFEMTKFNCGTDLHGDVFGSTCSVEHPAGPTDLTNIPGHGQIIVGEDSCGLSSGSPSVCGHVNNALWSVSADLQTEYTRLLTSPTLMSVGNPYWHPDLEGDAYLTTTINELYNEQGQLMDPAEASAVFGYIGPIIKADVPGFEAEDPVCYNKKESRYHCSTI